MMGTSAPIKKIIDIPDPEEEPSKPLQLPAKISEPVPFNIPQREPVKVNKG